MRHAAAVATLIACVVFTAACGSKDLSRAKAAELIAQNLQLPTPHMVDISSRYLRRSWNKPVVGFGNITICNYRGDSYSDVQARLLYYRTKNLINLSSTTEDGDCPAEWAVVTLTQEGQRHVTESPGGGYQAKVFDVAFGEITGIQVFEQLNTAKADYTLKAVGVTPFGGNISPEFRAGSATFALFDDGWRLQSIERASVTLNIVTPKVEMADDVLAKVDGQVVSVAEYRRLYEQQRVSLALAYGKTLDDNTLRQLGVAPRVLQRMVEAAAVLAEAARLGITVTDPELTDRIRQMPGFIENGRFIGDTRYRELLSRQKPAVSEADFRNDVLREMMAERLAAQIAGGGRGSGGQGGQDYDRNQLDAYIRDAMVYMTIVYNDGAVRSTVEK